MELWRVARALGVLALSLAPMTVIAQSADRLMMRKIR
jgi:hypothetical protein